MTTFTSQQLPTFVPGTDGIALPQAGPTVAYVVAPAVAQIKRPASWGAGQDLAIAAGTIHIAQDGIGDSYPNLEFQTFYEDAGPLDPSDERAAFLIAFWKERGYDVTPRQAKKTRAAVVLGVVTPDCAGATFKNHEGDSELLEGSRILQSPDDASVRWAITQKVFDKKYQPTKKN